jgi:pilus assembly protein Flp/PilA
VKEMFLRLWEDESGQAMTEYGLIIGLIAVALIGVLVLFKDKLAAIFTNITDNTELPDVPGE